MNVAQAKQLRMKDLLAALGCQPHHETKGEIWYPTFSRGKQAILQDRAGL